MKEVSAKDISSFKINKDGITLFFKDGGYCIIYPKSIKEILNDKEEQQ